jgi:hypothetical protein
VLVDFFQIVVQVPSVAPVREAYAQFFGYETVEDQPITDAIATHWGVPAIAGSQSCLMRPASKASSFIRFVEGAAVPSPGRLGWNGIELLVRDLDQTAEALEDSPFVEFSPPQQLSLSPKVRFMQVLGPAGELLFLNQMGEPNFGVGSASSDVDRPFVVTCGAQASPMPTSTKWARTSASCGCGLRGRSPRSRRSVHLIGRIRSRRSPFTRLIAGVSRPEPTAALEAA